MVQGIEPQRRADGTLYLQISDFRFWIANYSDLNFITVCSCCKIRNPGSGIRNLASLSDDQHGVTIGSEPVSVFNGHRISFH